MGMTDVLVEGALLGRSYKAIAEEHGYKLPGVYDLVATQKYKDAFDAARQRRRDLLERRLEAMSEAALRAQLEILADGRHVDRAKVADSVLRRAGLDQPTKVEVSNPYASMSAEELAAKHEAEARRLRGE